MFRIAVIAQLVITLTMVVVGIVSHDLFVNIAREDSIVEWMTALLFIGAGAAAGFSAWKAGRRGAPWITTGALALLCLALLVVGGEEISWGQRVFSIETPDRIKEINAQEEINLHNLATGLAQKAALFGSFLFGVCLPAACLLSVRIRRLYETRLHLQPPSPLIAVPCLLGYALCNPEWLLPTLTLTLTAACGGACAVALAQQKGNIGSAREPLILVAGIIGAVIVRIGLDVVGHWTNGWMELGEQNMAAAACLLALSTISAASMDTGNTVTTGAR